MSLKSICFFSSYYTGENIPKYVRFYLSELSRHFTEVLFLTNEKVLSADDLQFLSSHNISYRLYKNEGYDFGMWYKAFQECDIMKYDRVGLINDSCILFNKLDFYFDWLKKGEMDYCGMTDCKLITYHIQSYFIIINKKAIPLVLEYFKQHGIIADIKLLIRTYEIGLNTYLIQAGMKGAAYYSFKDDVSVLNPSLMKAKELIKKGAPLIKKRILTRLYGDASLRYMIGAGFDANPRNYIRLINKTRPEGNIYKLSSDIVVNWGWRKEVQFYSNVYFAELYFFIVHKMDGLKRNIKRILGRK